MNPPNPIRSFVFRVRFETVALVAGAVGVTFGMAHAIHQRAPRPTLASTEQPAWTGRIADLSASEPSANDAAMTSASLVVPRSSLALPTGPSRAAAKPRPCEPASCSSKPVVLLPAERRRDISVVATVNKSPAAGLLSKLNPLDHIPDAVRHPFDVASNALSGWFRHP